MNLRDKILELAQAQGKTFAKLERDCDLGNGSIRLWYNGRYPSSKSLYLVAKELDTTMDELMKGCVGEPNQDTSEKGDA